MNREALEARQAHEASMTNLGKLFWIKDFTFFKEQYCFSLITITIYFIQLTDSMFHALAILVRGIGGTFHNIKRRSPSFSNFVLKFNNSPM